MKIEDMIESLLIRVHGGEMIDNEMIGPVLLMVLQYLKEKENVR